MEFWVNYRRNHYRFQAEREDIERWENGQSVIIKRWVDAVLLVVASVVLVEIIKPLVADTSSLGPVLLRAGAVLGFAIVGLGSFLLWRNPFRGTTSGGNPGDCAVRGY